MAQNKNRKPSLRLITHCSIEYIPNKYNHPRLGTHCSIEYIPNKQKPSKTWNTLFYRVYTQQTETIQDMEHTVL